jgi:hypothetical protein
MSSMQTRRRVSKQAATAWAGWLVVDAPRGTESNVAVLRLRFAADAKGDIAAVVILPSLDETVREVADAGRNASPAHR